MKPDPYKTWEKFEKYPEQEEYSPYSSASLVSHPDFVPNIATPCEPKPEYKPEAGRLVLP